MSQKQRAKQSRQARFQHPGWDALRHRGSIPCAGRYNGSQRAATPRRGRELVRGNGTAGREAYITVNDRRILYDTEARGSQRDTDSVSK